MSKDAKLEKCECLTKHEKNTLTTALNSAIVDALRIINESRRGVNVIGKSPTEVRRDLEGLVGDYSELLDKVSKTPTCH
jgi:hypothetical protein